MARVAKYFGCLSFRQPAGRIHDHMALSASHSDGDGRPLSEVDYTREYPFLFVQREGEKLAPTVADDGPFEAEIAGCWDRDFHAFISLNLANQNCNESVVLFT